jgi:ABC-type Fe3+-hydroxamate transport system substrate-binding protein
MAKATKMTVYDDGLVIQFPVDKPPQRVVSLVPSVTESLFDLNLGGRLIACTDYCVHPADKLISIERVGGTKNPDIERIIALKPDMVIVNKEENRKEDAERLEEAGIPVWVTYPTQVPHVFNLLWDMMELFDETSMVPRVRLIEQTYDWVNSIASSLEHRPKVFVPIWLKPLMTINADTYVHDLLRVLGADNVFANHKERFPTITWEDVTKAQPDIVLLPSEPFQFTQAHIPLFQNMDIPATHHKRIYLVDGSLLTWHGTRIAYAMDQLPKLLRIEADKT